LYFYVLPHCGKVFRIPADETSHQADAARSALPTGGYTRMANEMNIHEYQAKGLLAKFGVAVPRGRVAFTPTEAEVATQELGGSVWVVKAQIHAGGRGKGGGVKVVKSHDAVKATTDRMLGMNLVTHQTGPAGKEVKRVYIEEGCDIARELYLSMLLDRATSWVTVMASTEGGMDIEEVAAKTPEKIIKVAIDPATGLQPFHARKIAFGLGLEGAQIRSAVTFLQGMYEPTLSWTRAWWRSTRW